MQRNFEGRDLPMMFWKEDSLFPRATNRKKDIGTQSSLVSPDNSCEGMNTREQSSDFWAFRRFCGYFWFWF